MLGLFGKRVNPCWHVQELIRVSGRLAHGLGRTIMLGALKTQNGLPHPQQLSPEYTVIYKRCAITPAVAEIGTGFRETAVKGISICIALLEALYPKVSPATVSVRCVEDPRLRLRNVRVCRECAVHIIKASGESVDKLKRLVVRDETTRG